MGRCTGYACLFIIACFFVATIAIIVSSNYNLYRVLPSQHKVQNNTMNNNMTEETDTDSYHPIQTPNSIFSEFCLYPITLYNETLRRLICNNKNHPNNISYHGIYPRDKSFLHRMASRVVFIHLSKTGGESVEATFRFKKSHKKAMDRLNEILSKNILSFTIIRNPYSRAFSWFKFCIHGWYDEHGISIIPNAPFSEHWHCNDCKFALSQWSDKYKNDKDITMENARIAFESWLINAFINKSNQYCLETNYPFNLYLSHSKTQQFLVDFIMKFETLHQDWNIFLDILGLDRNKYQLKHKNMDKLQGNKRRLLKTMSTRRVEMIPSERHLQKLLERNWTEYYTERAKQIVLDRFRVDFQLFNYHVDF